MCAVYIPVVRRFINLEGLHIDLDKTMTYVREKGFDDGVPRFLTETMLCVLNEVMIGGVWDPEERIPLWSEDIHVELGWFLRVHGQTSGNSYFQPIEIESDESIVSGYDSPTGVDEIWPSDESTNGTIDLDGGITDEDMNAAFWVLDLMNAPIGDFNIETDEI